MKAAGRRCLYPRLSEGLTSGPRPGLAGHERSKSARGACRVLPSPEVEGLWMTTALVSKSGSPSARPSLCGPEDVADLVRHLGHRPVEEVLLIPVDAQNQAVGIVRLSQGSEARSEVPALEAIRAISASGATRAILVHNHPSGSIAPSIEDRDVAKRLGMAFTLVGAELLDSVVVTARGHASLKEQLR